MISRCAVLAIAFLLVFSASPLAVAASPSVVITNPKQIDLRGPRVDVINFEYYDDTTAAIAAHSIMGNELTLTVASYNNLASDRALTVGSTVRSDNVGLQFNMLRPVTNNTHFRRAIYFLQNFSYYQNTLLSHIAGTATPTVFPCVLYLAACKGGPHKTPAEKLYGGMNLQRAIDELKLTESDPNPLDRLYEGNTTDIFCDTSGGATCSNLTWHSGSLNGPIWSPRWMGRTDLSRHGIAAYIISQAAKIGLDLSTNYCEDSVGCRLSPALRSSTAVIRDGKYDPRTGYNSPPVYNLTRAYACNDLSLETADCWDIYSYWIGCCLASSQYYAESFNSAYGSAAVNVALFYNKTVDHDTNAMIYAKTISGLNVATSKVSFEFMQNLPWQNVYLMNDLWAVLSNSWAGYVGVPTQTPTSQAGLYFSMLNVHQRCFPSSCLSGGTVNFGLAGLIYAPGGLTPLEPFDGISGSDITQLIYESPTITGPSQFTSPSTYTQWMTRAFKVASFSTPKGRGLVGGNGIWLAKAMSQSTSQVIKDGQVITIDFLPNIYFSDHVQMTAYDYNFSLYVSDIVNNPFDKPLANVNSWMIAAWTQGLIATYINPANPLEIKLYMNSSTVWNLGSTVWDPVIVPVVPMHIFKFFDMFNSYAFFHFDTSFNYNGTIQEANGCESCINQKAGPPPAWLIHLANLEVGTGPFLLRSWDGVGQRGQLLRNPTYYRAAWSMNDTNNQVKRGSTFTFKGVVYEWTYDPVACASATDQVCKVPIASGVTASVLLLNSAGKTLTTYPLTCDSHGTCSGSIDTISGFRTGDNELAFVAQYTYLGLSRTWYQLTGVYVHK
jgi:hypothetical protein